MKAEEKIVKSRGWELPILANNHRRSQGGGGAGDPAPPYRNATNDKNITKKATVFSICFSILAYNSTRAQQ